MTGEIFISLPAFLSKYYDFWIYNLSELKEYTKFVTHHFQKNGKYINKMLYLKLYQLFDGIICYIRSMIVFLSFWLRRTLKKLMEDSVCNQNLTSRQELQSVHKD